jgi:hypothetical protein
MRWLLLTHCSDRSQLELAERVLPAWQDAFPGATCVVGMPASLHDQATQSSIADYCLPAGKSFGDFYTEQLAEREFDAAILFAPYALPADWLAGSVAAWLTTFSLIGRYKLPRVLSMEKILGLTLIAPNIVELGRLRMDFVIVRSDLKPFANCRLYEQWIGSEVLVRARPATMLLYSALRAGAAILTLPDSCHPVRFLMSRQDFQHWKIERAKAKGRRSP